MSEVKVLINRKPLAYEGLFRTDELSGLIKRFGRERGYFVVERLSEEHALAHGKDIIFELSLIKTLSDYAKGVLSLDIRITGLTDRVVTIDKEKRKYQQARVDIHTSARLETDYRGRWEGDGFGFLFRVISDKFIRHGVIHELDTQIRNDCLALQEEIRALLNLHRLKVEGK